MSIFTKVIERARETIWEGEGISYLPATKEFLEAKGLQSIRELDKQGMHELKEYLKKTLEVIESKNKKN